MLLGHSSTRFDKLPVGSFIEVSPTSFRIAHQVGRLLAAKPPPSDISGRSRSLPKDEAEVVERGEEVGVGGCGLIIDYGGANVFGDSFRVSFHLSFL
jgi:NADH dehydrogenase [ubiquinone] 1 alpha subcomplex assembly factor 7